MSVIASFMAAPFTGPTVITTEVLARATRADSAGSAASAYNLAAIEAVCERLPDVPQVACFDTSFHRGHARSRRAGSLASRDLIKGRRRSATAFTASLRIHRFGLAARSRLRLPRAA